MNPKFFKIGLIFVIIFGMTAQLYAAQNKPVEMQADSIEYDSVTGIMYAKGGVVLTQDKAVLTGANGEYNTKSQEAWVTGGVKVVKEDTTLTADQIRSYNNTHLIATGDAILTKGEDSLTGPMIDYYSDKQYAVVPEAGHLSMADGVMTADKIEAFLNESRAVGTGSVHIVSTARQLDATSDNVVYYGAKSEQGRAVLTGNAHAVQDGNVLTGNTITIYLDDKVMDAQGRTKLVLKPQ